MVNKVGKVGRELVGVVEHVRDLNYLEQAEAHADEGPLGNAAAVAILKMALKYARIHNSLTAENAALRAIAEWAISTVEDAEREADRTTDDKS
jgi:hypothetical protein